MEWLDAGEMFKCLNQNLGGWDQLLQSWSGYTVTSRLYMFGVVTPYQA